MAKSKKDAAPKLAPTGVLAEYRHPKTGKISRYPLLQVNNGVDGNRTTHLVQLPSGDLAREHEVEGQFIRYTQDDDKDGQ